MPALPTLEEDRARGRAARRATPRSSHGEWVRDPARVDPLAILAVQAETRDPRLVPIRHGRMARDPLAFYRGAAAIMAADLAGRPHTGLLTQLCGDAHLGNFGGFAAPDRQLVFDLNDFDETLPGPFEWDVQRLAASVAITGRHNGLTAEQRAEAIAATAGDYRRAIREFAECGPLEVWYTRLSLDRLEVARQSPRLDRAVAKARRKDSLRAVAKLTEEVDGVRRIVSDPPVVVPLTQLVGEHEREGVQQYLAHVLDSYRDSLAEDRRHLLDQYATTDVAHKIVGVGSVGLRAWIVLLEDAGGAPLVLQVKEAQASVFEPFAGTSRFAQHGQRVVQGQRLMQSASDVMLGWVHVERGFDGRRRDLYVRQLWDSKLSLPIETMDGPSLTAYARTCGWTLARAHARAGGRRAIAAYLGGGDAFDRAMVAFGERYADQNERDHAAFVVAIAAGDVPSRDA